MSESLFSLLLGAIVGFKWGFIGGFSFALFLVAKARDHG